MVSETLSERKDFEDNCIIQMGIRSQFAEPEEREPPFSHIPDYILVPRLKHFLPRL